jgi:hypothetical protein
LGNVFVNEIVFAEGLDTFSRGAIGMMGGVMMPSGNAILEKNFL